MSLAGHDDGVGVKTVFYLTHFTMRPICLSESFSKVGYSSFVRFFKVSARIWPQACHVGATEKFFFQKNRMIGLGYNNLVLNASTVLIFELGSIDAREMLYGWAKDKQDSIITFRERTYASRWAPQVPVAATSFGGATKAHQIQLENSRPKIRPEDRSRWDNRVNFNSKKYKTCTLYK